MSDKLTTEQLQYIQTIDRTDDVSSRHLRMMATEILNFRLGSVAKQIDLLPHVAIIEQERQVDKDISAFPLTWFKGWQFKNSENEWETYKKPEIYWGGGNQVRRHPHADIIMQCEDDKRLYPDFYKKLFQFSYDGWESWKSMEDVNPVFWKDYLYRQHPHRALIIKANELKILSDNWYRCFQYKEHTAGSKWQNWTHNCDFINTDNYDYRLNPHWEKIIEFHQCSDEDKKCWQMKWDDSEWINSTNPDWSAQYYRLRPKVCQVTLQNGDVLEYPEPVREPLEKGKEYWLVNLCCLEVCKMELGEFCSDEEQSYLASGSIHLTEQAAQTHLRVLQAVNAQVAL